MKKIIERLINWKYAKYYSFVAGLLVGTIAFQIIKYIMRMTQ